MYKVFTRNWWRIEKGKLVPNTGGRKYTLEYFNTEEEAQIFCREYNKNHKPGKLSHKAEYTDKY